MTRYVFSILALILLSPLKLLALENFKYEVPCQGSDVSKWSQCVGQLSSQDGTKYIGDFQNGAANGYGFMQTPSKDQIIGEFKDNNVHGIGLHLKPDGERYAGEFKENKYHGRGLYKKSSGEMINGKWKRDQFKEVIQGDEDYLLRLIAIDPAKRANELLSNLGSKSSAGSSPNISISGQPDSNSKGQLVSNQSSVFDANKVYKFAKGLGGPRGVCVTEAGWGSGYNRDVSKSIPLWGLEIYSVFPGAKRQLGFLWGHDYYFRFENQIVPLGTSALNEARLNECSYILVKGEELNQTPALQRVILNPLNEFKETYSLNFADAEREWLNALGYKDRSEYDKASTIAWMLAQPRYAELSKAGITNGDEFQMLRKRKSSIPDCSEAYEDNMQGNIDFANDEVLAKKAKAQVVSYCSRRVAKMRAEYARLSKQKISVSAYCNGNQSGTVSTYVSQMDSGGVDVAIRVLRANGCVFGQANFNKANSELYYEGKGFVALKLKTEDVYAVTTKYAWDNPTK